MLSHCLPVWGSPFGIPQNNSIDIIFTSCAYASCFIKPACYNKNYTELGVSIIGTRASFMIASFYQRNGFEVISALKWRFTLQFCMVSKVRFKLKTGSHGCSGTPIRWCWTPVEKVSKQLWEWQHWTRERRRKQTTKHRARSVGMCAMSNLLDYVEKWAPELPRLCKLRREGGILSFSFPLSDTNT